MITTSDVFVHIKSLLGIPYYESSDVVLYNYDCFDAVKTLANSHFTGLDCTITSPPYNIGKEYEVIRPLEEYIDWLVKIFEVIYEITAADGALLLNLGYLHIDTVGRAIPIPYLIWDKLRYFLQQEIVWNYGAGVASRRKLSPRNEKILWYLKSSENYVFNLDAIRDPDVKYPNQKKHGVLRCNSLGKNPSDVWRIAKVTSGTNRSSSERTGHPAQFPEALIDRLVKGFTKKDSLILDPFFGSGTTAISCAKNSRKCLGFEIRKDYCDIAVGRLEHFYKM